MIPDDFLRNLGDVIVCFAMLENTFKTLTHSLLGSSQQVGQIVTAELSFKAIRALASSLYKQRNGNDECSKSFEQILSRATKIEATRNQITHSTWLTYSGAASVTRFKATARESKGIQFKADDYTSETLEKFATEIKDLANDVSNLWVLLVENGKATNCSVV